MNLPKALFPCSLLTLAFLPSPAAAQQPHGGRLDALHDFVVTDAEGTDLPHVVPAGDLNGDGFDDLLIGRPFDGTGGVDEGGSVELVSGIDFSPLMRWYGSQSDSEFGMSLAVTGDVDGDGFNDVTIGAPLENHGGRFETGGVYLYSGQPPYALINSWEGQDNWDFFGEVLVDAGDMNGDGRSDLLIGSPFADDESNQIYDSGQVDLYSGADPQATGLIRQWSGVWDSESFGRALLAPGDLNGDGIADFVIGAPGEEPPTTFYFNPGRVFVISGADGSVITILEGEEDDDYFGSSLASPGDLDGDLVPDLLVGAPFADLLTGTFKSGMVTLYSGATGEDFLFWTGEGKFDLFGYSIDAGDVDDDGVADILVGAPTVSTDGVTNRGAFYAFSGTSGEKVLYQEGADTNQVLGAFLRFAGDVNNDGLGDLAAPRFEWLSMFQPEGRAALYSSEIVPQMSASADTLTNSSGGTVLFDLDFPAEARFYWYQLLYSGAGTGPTSIQGLPVPLGYDVNLVNTYLGNYQPGFTDPTGLLDNQGDATARLSVPAGAIPPGVLNSTFYFAAICRLPWGQWEYSSVALPVTFLP